MTDKLIKVAVVGDKEEAKSFQVTRQYTPEDSDSDQDGSHDHVRSKVYQLVHVNTCKGWESAEILKSVITNFKSIDKRLKSAEVIRPIKSINTGNSSHLMIKKASYHFHIVHYLPSHAGKVCRFE